MSLDTAWKLYNAEAKGLGKAMRWHFMITDGDHFPNVAMKLLEKAIGEKRLVKYGKPLMIKWLKEMMRQHYDRDLWDEEIEEEVDSFLEWIDKR